MTNKESVTHLVAFLWRLVKTTVFATHSPVIKLLTKHWYSALALNHNTAPLMLMLMDTLKGTLQQHGNSPKLAKKSTAELERNTQTS